MSKRERNKIAVDKYRALHYHKMDPALKKEHYKEAAKKRGEARRLAGAPERAKRALAQELRLVARVINGLRLKILEKERRRVKALADYHKKAAVINERRRRPALLHRAFRKALSGYREQESRLTRLEMSFRKVLTRASNKAERKLRKRLCSRFERAMKQKAVSSFILRLSGTSLAGVRAHLESQFVAGMSWDNHGYGPGFWNIDHIRPLASFKLSYHEQALQAFHFTNLQPLWHEDNMEKRDSYFPR